MIITLVGFVVMAIAVTAIYMIGITILLRYIIQDYQDKDWIQFILGISILTALIATPFICIGLYLQGY